MSESSGSRRTVADRLAELFPGESIALVDRVDAMGTIFDGLADQRPSTCGAYALRYLLPAVGFPEHDGNDLSAEDYLAYLAAVVIEGHEVGPSAEITARVAAGELSEAEARARFPQSWYRYPLRASDDPVVQGTSPTGVARAVAIGTAGALGTVPVAGRDRTGSPQLTPDRWAALLALVEAHLVDWRLHVIFNYDSDQLLAPRSSLYTAEALRAPADARRIPRDDWGVGHFAGLAGLWRRPDGERWLVLFDSYKARGFAGYQPQPADLMRLGVVRSDGRNGGVLLIVPREHLAAATAAVEQLGVELGTWSNGSLEPDDWAWERGR